MCMCIYYMAWFALHSTTSPHSTNAKTLQWKVCHVRKKWGPKRSPGNRPILPVAERLDRMNLLGLRLVRCFTHVLAFFFHWGELKKWRKTCFVYMFFHDQFYTNYIETFLTTIHHHMSAKNFKFWGVSMFWEFVVSLRKDARACVGLQLVHLRESTLWRYLWCLWTSSTCHWRKTSKKRHER